MDPKYLENPVYKRALENYGKNRNREYIIQIMSVPAEVDGFVRLMGLSNKGRLFELDAGHWLLRNDGIPDGVQK